MLEPMGFLPFITTAIRAATGAGRATALVLVLISPSIAQSVPPAISEMIREARASSDSRVKAAILSDLSTRRARNPSELQAVHNALRDLERDSRVGKRAPGLAMLSASFEKFLTNSTDETTSESAINLLEEDLGKIPAGYKGAWGARDSNEQLAETLRTNRLKALVSAVAGSRNPRARPVLRRMLEHDGLLGQIAIDGLGQLGDSRDLDELVGKLKKESKSRISLKSFGTPALDRLLREIDDPALPENQKVNLIASLAQFADRENVPRFLVLTKHSNPRVAEIAVRAVGRSVTRADKNTIAKMISSPDRKMRLEALMAIDRDFSKEDGPTLIGVLERDVDPGIRAQAARILGEHAVQEARDALMTASANDESTWVKEFARSALSQLSKKK